MCIRDRALTVLLYIAHGHKRTDVVIVDVGNGNKLIKIFKSRLIFYQNYKVLAAYVLFVGDYVGMLIVVYHIGLYAVYDLYISACLLYTSCGRRGRNGGQGRAVGHAQ